jgi:hypothetical protein
MVQSIYYYWTNHDYASTDGMPFIGRASSSAQHLLVATGFNAWGITTGTAAGMILSDLALGRAKPLGPGLRRHARQAGHGSAKLVRENGRVAAELAQRGTMEQRLDQPCPAHRAEDVTSDRGHMASGRACCRQGVGRVAGASKRDGDPPSD